MNHDNNLRFVFKSEKYSFIEYVYEMPENYKLDDIIGNLCFWREVLLHGKMEIRFLEDKQCIRENLIREGKHIQLTASEFDSLVHDEFIKFLNAIP